MFFPFPHLPRLPRHPRRPWAMSSEISVNIKEINIYMYSIFLVNYYNFTVRIFIMEIRSLCKR